MQRIRQAEQLPQPVEGHLLELLQGRRGAPEDPYLVEPCDQELGEDSGLGGGRREVGEVARALPVRDPGHQDLVQVAKHGGKRLGLVGRRIGQRGPDRTRLDPRQDRVLAHVLEIACDPVECGSTVVAERAHALPAVIAAQARVFSTCSFVSHARRAWPIPSSA